MAHTVRDDDQALALGGGTIWRTLCVSDSVTQWHYMAHTVCDDDQALALGGGTIWHTLCVRIF